MSNEVPLDSNADEICPLKMCQALIKEEDSSSEGTEHRDDDSLDEDPPHFIKNNSSLKHEPKDSADSVLMKWRHSLGIPLTVDIKSESNLLPDPEAAKRLVKAGLDSLDQEGSCRQKDLSTPFQRSRFNFLEDEESLYINISRDLPPSSSQGDTSVPALGYPPTRRKFQCDSCERSFKKGHDLKRHLLVHTGEKPFECRHCNRKFNLKGDMKRHEFSHLETKPFSCDSCGKSFKRKDYLKTHIEIHTSQKQYPCPYCNKHFKHKSSVKKHKCKSPVGRTS